MAGGYDPSKSEGINEINITPFVDVVLVLLVIFMVTAPMMMKDLIGLKLPKTKTADSQTMSTLSIAITKEGQVLLNGELVSDEILSSKSAEQKNKNPDTQVIIAADVDARHGDVIRVIDIIKAVGIDNFAIQVNRQSK
jgi:biopolymer transport protein ExbD